MPRAQYPRKESGIGIISTKTVIRGSGCYMDHLAILELGLFLATYSY